MDPEEHDNNPKALSDTVVGDAKNDEDIILLEAASTAQPGPELHTENGPDVFDSF